jgi:hypothetical protein
VMCTVYSVGLPKRGKIMRRPMRDRAAPPVYTHSGICEPRGGGGVRTRGALKRDHQRAATLSVS